MFFINVPIGLLVLWGESVAHCCRPVPGGPLGGIGAAFVNGGAC